jgi:PAS domain S-box-containing protein
MKSAHQAQRLYWLMALPVIIFIATIIWLIHAIYHDADRHEQVLTQAFELKYLHARLLYLGDLLPLTLYTTIVRDKDTDLSHYQQQRLQMDDFVQRLGEMYTPNLLLNIDARLAEQIKAQHERLRAHEDEALQWLANAPRNKALSELENAMYVGGREEFGRRVTQLAQEVEHAFHWELAQDTRRIHSRILSLLVLVLLLAMVWFALLKRAHAAHLALLKTEQELRQRTTALHESSARLSAILNTVIDGIITIDARGTIESINPAMTEIFGYSEAELIGQPINILMPEHDARRHDAYLNHYLETGEQKIIGIGRKVMGRRKDGTEIPVDLAVAEMYFGTRRMFSGLIRDLSKHAPSP